MTTQHLERIFRQTCTECPRPAVTLDEDETPRCPRHMDAVIRDERGHTPELEESA